MEIIEYIPVGAGNAITARQIASMADCNTRAVRAAIQAARRRGVPICASCAAPFGYFVAESPDDLRLYLQSLNRRTAHIMETKEACTAIYDHMTGQAHMEGFL